MAARRSSRVALALGLLAALVLAGCAVPTPPGGPPGGGAAQGVKVSCGGGGAMMNATAGGTSAAGALGLAAGDRASPLPGAAPGAAQQQDRALTIGTLMPMTGSLEAYGPDGVKAVQLAVDEVNAAGGVNGEQVAITSQDDESTNQAKAPQTFQTLVTDGASAVIGGYASSVTGAVLESAITAKVMVVTPASTSPVLTADRENQGYFLRVPPSDALQGKVLARVVWEDGCRTATLLEVNNAYGVGLGGVFGETFRSLGGTVRNEIKFDENAQTFSSETQRAGADNSDAIVLVAYPGQGTPIMKEAFQRGIMQRSVFFFSEGVKEVRFVNDTGKAGNKFILEGLRGTAPGSVSSPGFAHFNASFSAEFGHAPTLFAAEAYDAAWMIALAAQCGGANTGQAIRDNILKVANRDAATDVAVSGGNATLALTTARLPGCNLDYRGAAHDFNFDARGDPADGVYTVWRVAADGSLTTVQENLRP